MRRDTCQEEDDGEEVDINQKTRHVALGKHAAKLSVSEDWPQVPHQEKRAVTIMNRDLLFSRASNLGTSRQDSLTSSCNKTHDYKKLQTRHGLIHQDGFHVHKGASFIRTLACSYVGATDRR